MKPLRLRRRPSPEMNWTENYRSVLPGMFETDLRGWTGNVHGFELFISEAYNARQVLAVLAERVEQVSAPLIKPLQQLEILAQSGKIALSLSHNAAPLASATPSLGIVSVYGNNAERQKDFELGLHVFAHELAHLANPRTGGAPDSHDRDWTAAHKTDNQIPVQAGYTEEDMERELWANTVASLTVEAAGIPCEFFIQAANGLFELWASQQWPLRSKVATTYIEGRPSPTRKRAGQYHPDSLAAYLEDDLMERTPEGGYRIADFSERAERHLARLIAA